jgi:ribosomal protein L14E/L6E/L27E
VYTRFIEIGRVALVNYGPDAGKLCTIIDILDQNRVLVDGPANITGVHRQLLTMKRLTLTDFKVVIGRQARYVANANSTHHCVLKLFSRSLPLCSRRTIAHVDGVAHLSAAAVIWFLTCLFPYSCACAACVH